MDWLIARQADIESALAARHLHDGSALFLIASSKYIFVRLPPDLTGHSPKLTDG
jgi:hypothetical protein